MKTQLVDHHATAQPAILGEGGAILNMIERAARDPSVDVDKMQKLMEMSERVRAREAETAFNSALTECQSKMRRVEADCKNSQTNSKYVSYAALDRALRPIYTDAGFSLSFDTGETAAETVLVLCHVAHRNGHSRTYRALMPADGKGAKGGDVMTKTHAAGSAMSYGMRYLLKMIFNVAVGEDDDDGNGAAQSLPRINEDQRATIQALIEDVGADKAAFLRFLKCSSIADIPAQGYAQAVKALEAKRKQVKS